MNILKNKNIAILGLGHHGGGASAAQFAHHEEAKSITILDQAPPNKINIMLKQLENIKKFLSLGTYNASSINKYDILIKNPAIPRDSEIIQSAIQSQTKIETDISLFFQHQPTPTWMITGTKGKSSVSTALYNLVIKQKTNAVLGGNITSSPLNIILDSSTPEKIILELSSFQLGDLTLITKSRQASLFNNMELMILTNILPDHLNYYSSMKSYVADKLVAFRNIPSTTLALLPYTKNTVAFRNNMLEISLFGNTITLPPSQCYFHSLVPLPPYCKGSWVDTQGLWIKTDKDSNPTLLIKQRKLPSHIPSQNISIVANTFITQKITPLPEILPRTISEWNNIFSIAHRKEIVAEINNRILINDSAATIPQAMQLQLFKDNPILLIAGGTDKNLEATSFISAIRLVKKLYLLEGSFTNHILTILAATSIPYSGPYKSLLQALTDAYNESNPYDTIILSPGCASFGMFLHEFDRGNQFRNLVLELQNTAN